VSNSVYGIKFQLNVFLFEMKLLHIQLQSHILQIWLISMSWNILTSYLMGIKNIIY